MLLGHPPWSVVLRQNVDVVIIDMVLELCGTIFLSDGKIPLMNRPINDLPSIVDAEN